MEFYNRFLIGQPDGNNILPYSISYDEYDEWRNKTKELFFPDLKLGSSYSYSKEPVSYEIWSEMRYKRNLHNKEDDMWIRKTLFSS